MLTKLFLLFNFFTISFSKLIRLNNYNSVILRGPVTSVSVSKWINNINSINDDTIYIYITSPGGSVYHGNLFIEQIKSLNASGKKIECIAEFAASMAFTILQSCPIRYALDSSILMQHQISLQLGGNIKNINSYLEYINDLSVQLNKNQASRLELSDDEFNSRVVHDWWISGYKAQENNVVDDMVRVLCSSGLIDSEDMIIVDGFFDKIKLKFSKCPLISQPKNVNNELNQYLTPYISDLAINQIRQGNYFNEM